MYEQLNADGVRCDMVTGQEVLRVPGSGHVACTVEMVGLNAHADVAVIDEIQVRLVAPAASARPWPRRQGARQRGDLG